MTIDEAIIHFKKEAEQQIQRIDNLSDIPMFGGSDEDIKLIEKCEKCAEEYRQLAEWLKELKQLREQTTWIPCSERLPEEKQDVLACFYTGNGNYKLMVSCRIDYNYWEGVGRTGDMVAWMPLPEPYKGE